MVLGQAARVVVQHRCRFLRDELAGRLAGEPDITPVGGAAGPDELLDLCQHAAPDIALVEVCPEAWDAAAVAARLRARAPTLRVIGLHGQLEPAEAARVRRAGIDSLVGYTEGLAAVLTAVRAERRARMCPAAERDLTERELEVLRLLATGSTTRQAAEALRLSPHTVENHKRRIFEKLGVQSQAHAVAYAARKGLLLEPEPAAAVPPPVPAGAKPLAHGLVLGQPRLVRELLACALASRGVRIVVPEPAAPPGREKLVAVLANPSPRDWDTARALGARVVLVSHRPLGVDGLVEAVLRGADAVVPSTKTFEQLVRAICLVSQGHTLLDARLARALVDAARTRLAARSRPVPELTAREREILLSIDRGDSVRQTARALGISVKTVENLQSRLFRKLGARNRAQAIAAAHDLGLLAAEPAARGGR